MSDMHPLEKLRLELLAYYHGNSLIKAVIQATHGNGLVALAVKLLTEYHSPKLSSKGKS
jgi:hypothetical protein